jgi:protein involved in ribonucleotide reduction
VQEYIRKNNQPKQEDFVPNLLDSLRRHKLLKENPVEVLDQVGIEGAKKLVRVKIETQTEYFLITDFFGFSIEKTWDGENVPEEVRNYLNNYNNLK